MECSICSKAKSSGKRKVGCKIIFKDVRHAQIPLFWETAIVIAVDASGPSESGEWNFLTIITIKVRQETARLWSKKHRHPAASSASRSVPKALAEARILYQERVYT